MSTTHFVRSMPLLQSLRKVFDAALISAIFAVAIGANAGQCLAHQPDPDPAVTPDSGPGTAEPSGNRKVDEMVIELRIPKTEVSVFTPPERTRVGGLELEMDLLKFITDSVYNPPF